MQKQKFNTSLMSRIYEEKEFEKKQEKLKTQYGIDKEKKIVVVEKTNTYKFTVRTVAALIRIFCTVILLALAVTGLFAVLYPDTRDILWQTALELFTEIQQYVR